MTKIIETKKICKQYGEYSVLTDVSLTVQEGDFVAITGASGSGKSTLLHILGCMDDATSGELIVSSKTVTGKTKKALAKLRNRDFGFVFQFFYLDPFLTVEKNLEIPLFLRDIKLKERKELAQEIAKKVGIEDLLEKYPVQLSGGQQQRVAIGRALIGKPKILFLDEPTGNLDSQNSAKIIHLIRNLQKTEALTVIMVTHDNKIAQSADSILRIKDGKLC